MQQDRYILSEDDEINKRMLCESSQSSEFYRINIKFNCRDETTGKIKAKNIIFKANSTTAIVLQNEMFVKNIDFARNLMIFSNIYSGCNELCIPKTLIDEDYMGFPVVYVLNNRDFDMSCSEFDFKVNQFFYDPSETNIHTFPLFYIDEEDMDDHIPMICGFRKSTTGANALDIIMNKEYSINSLEILDIPCKFYFNTSTLDYQNLFLMRSRFSKNGIFCELDQQMKILRVINQSNKTIYLGNTFLQLLLPTPLCFCLDSIIVNKPLLLVHHSLKEEYRVFHSYSKNRKNKY